MLEEAAAEILHVSNEATVNSKHALVQVLKTLEPTRVWGFGIARRGPGSQPRGRAAAPAAPERPTIPGALLALTFILEGDWETVNTNF